MNIILQQSFCCIFYRTGCGIADAPSGPEGPESCTRSTTCAEGHGTSHLKQVLTSGQVAKASHRQAGLLAQPSGCDFCDLWHLRSLHFQHL